MELSDYILKALYDKYIQVNGNVQNKWFLGLEAPTFSEYLQNNFDMTDLAKYELDDDELMNRMQLIDQQTGIVFNHVLDETRKTILRLLGKNLYRAYQHLGQAGDSGKINKLHDEKFLHNCNCQVCSGNDSLYLTVYQDDLVLAEVKYQKSTNRLASRFWDNEAKSFSVWLVKPYEVSRSTRLENRQLRDDFKEALENQLTHTLVLWDWQGKNDYLKLLKEGFKKEARDQMPVFAQEYNPVTNQDW